MLAEPKKNRNDRKPIGKLKPVVEQNQSQQGFAELRPKARTRRRNAKFKVRSSYMAQMLGQDVTTSVHNFLHGSGSRTIVLAAP